MRSAYLAYDAADVADEYGWLWIDADGLEGWQLVRTIEDDEALSTYVVTQDRTYDGDWFAGRPYLPVREPKIDGDDIPPGVIVTVDLPGGRRITFTWTMNAKSEELAEAICQQLRAMA